MALHKHHHHRRGGAFAQAAELEERKVDVRKAKPQTIVSVIYTTAAPTFDGPVAGYTTLGPAVGPPVQVQQQPQQFAPAPSPTPQVVQSVEPPNVLGGGLLAHSPQQTTAQRTASAAATTIGDPSTQTSSASDPSSPDSSPAQATPEAFNPPTTTSDPATAASATAGPGTASATAKSSSSGGGTSGGAKAGIAFAVLLGIGALAALLFFLWRKKKAAKNAAYNKTVDEKHNDNMVPGNYPHPDNGMAYGAGAARSMSMRTADAPRLSLRPVTQFDPHLAGQRKSSGNPKAVALAPGGGAASPDQQRSVAPPATQRKPLNPTGPSRVNDPANPFGSHAEASDHLAPGVIPAAAAAGGAAPRPITRFPSAAGNAEREAAMATNRDRGMPSAQPNEPFAAAAAPMPAGSSPPQQQLRAPSPTASEYSSFSVPASPSKTGAAVAGGALAAGAAGAAAGGNGASPVHRVQLDFKPSMDDELGLQAGQLVRLLHEYDDGWALCIRMDRSQQGVCPRTCLSTRPVKPRPAQGGPRGLPPGMRGPPHMQQPGRPMSPANGGRQSPGPRMQPGYAPNGSPYAGPPGRPMSPSYGFPPAPRPLSPGGRRAPSPGPRQGGRPRNSSDPFARGGRPMSPSGHRNGGGRPRSNSGSQLVAQGGGRMPPGPSRMNPNASPPLGSQPRQPYNPQDVPMVLRSVGSGQPQYNAGPGSSPPNQNPLKAVARKPAPGQAM